MTKVLTNCVNVTPLVGVWIEMTLRLTLNMRAQSLPLWECGLKLVYCVYLSVDNNVTPLVGVWIEIYFATYLSNLHILSLPLWECGLK